MQKSVRWLSNLSHRLLIAKAITWVLQTLKGSQMAPRTGVGATAGHPTGKIRSIHKKKKIHKLQFVLSLIKGAKKILAGMSLGNDKESFGQLITGNHCVLLGSPRRRPSVCAGDCFENSLCTS